MTPMMYANRAFRAHDHKFTYDFETLGRLLTQVGFVEVAKESFKKGRNQSLLIDSEHRAVESLYVEGMK
jgi:hypothetical protein